MMQKGNKMHEGFEPVIDDKSKILILGSFPSVKSREANFYYGNKQNRIWKMFERFFQVKIGDAKEEKIKFLLKYHIAMWDIVKSSSLKGSSDSNLLKSVEGYNNIQKLLEKYPNISAVFCNGKASFNLTMQFFPELSDKIVYLPSTSPANVSFSENKWFEEMDKYLK